MKLDGIRYLEKPPLPYWLDAVCYWIFGQNVFATHLPNALAILGLAWWLALGSRGWGPRAGFYAALGVLTSIGPFLFTRFAIPEALLSFLLLTPCGVSSPAWRAVIPSASTACGRPSRLPR